jgi:hypothetical protein
MSLFKARVSNTSSGDITDFKLLCDTTIDCIERTDTIAIGKSLLIGIIAKISKNGSLPSQG